MEVIGVGGFSGVGKTTLFREVFKKFDNLVEFGILKGYKYNNIFLLGVYNDNVFSGTDRLSMSVITKLKEYILLNIDKKEKIIFEGDRLFHEKFMIWLCENQVKNRFIILDEEIRREERGITQSERFLKSNKTKYTRMRDYCEIMKKGELKNLLTNIKIPEKVKKVCNAELNSYYDLKHYDIIVDNYLKPIYKEDGSLLCVLVKEVYDKTQKEIFTKILHKRGKSKTKNRGSAAGVCDIKQFPKGAEVLIDPKTHKPLKEGHKYVSVKYRDKNGKVCSRCQSNVKRSNSIGYFDKVGALPCRLVGWSRDNLEKHNEILPMVHRAEDIYKAYAPDTHKKQRELADKKPHFTLDNSCFSTITTNYDFRTAAHRDRGDFKEGLAVMSVFEVYKNNYEGFYLGFPEYKLCIKVEDNDILLFDPHEVHCNTEGKYLGINKTEFDDLTKQYHMGRVSNILYLRNRLHKCEN